MTKGNILRRLRCGHPWRRYSFDEALDLRKRDVWSLTFCTTTGNLITLDPDPNAPMWSCVEVVPCFDEDEFQ